LTQKIVATLKTHQKDLDNFGQTLKQEEERPLVIEHELLKLKSKVQKISDSLSTESLDVLCEIID